MGEEGQSTRARVGCRADTGLLKKEGTGLVLVATMRLSTHNFHRGTQELGLEDLFLDLRALGVISVRTSIDVVVIPFFHLEKTRGLMGCCTVFMCSALSPVYP